MIELTEIQAARARIADVAVRTPLIRLRADEAPAEIYLKLETLQPIGSFKIRGAINAVRQASKAERGRGLVTASAGNMAQGVAWAGRELGLPVTIAVPEHAPEAKLAAMIRALRPQTKIFTAEPATGAALVAALAAGGPVDVEYSPSFVDGSGSRRVLDSMWPRVSPLVDDAFDVQIADAAAAVRTLAARARVVAEGAGALATAAALAGRAGTGKVVCIVSGGNIDLAKLAGILEGGDS